MLTTVFSDIASGLGVFIPAFAKAFLDAFTNLFIITDATTQAISLTPVAELGIVFMVIYIGYKVLPTVISWFKLWMARRKARKASKKI